MKLSPTDAVIVIGAGLLIAIVLAIAVYLVVEEWEYKRWEKRKETKK